MRKESVVQKLPWKEDSLFKWLLPPTSLATSAFREKERIRDLSGIIFFLATLPFVIDTTASVLLNERKLFVLCCFSSQNFERKWCSSTSNKSLTNTAFYSREKVIFFSNLWLQSFCASTGKLHQEKLCWDFFLFCMVFSRSHGRPSCRTVSIVCCLRIAADDTTPWATQTRFCNFRFENFSLWAVHGLTSACGLINGYFWFFFQVYVQLISKKCEWHYLLWVIQLHTQREQ